MLRRSTKQDEMLVTVVGDAVRLYGLAVGEETVRDATVAVNFHRAVDDTPYFLEAVLLSDVGIPDGDYEGTLPHGKTLPEGTRGHYAEVVVNGEGRVRVWRIPLTVSP